MTVFYELHIWTRDANLAAADRVILLPCDNDDDAADAWERRFSEGVRIELLRYEGDVCEVLKAVF